MAIISTKWHMADVAYGFVIDEGIKSQDRVLLCRPTASGYSGGSSFVRGGFLKSICLSHSLETFSFSCRADSNVTHWDPRVSILYSGICEEPRGSYRRPLIICGMYSVSSLRICCFLSFWVQNSSFFVGIVRAIEIVNWFSGNWSSFVLRRCCKYDRSFENNFESKFHFPELSMCALRPFSHH